MPNVLEYAKIFQSSLDKLAVQEATSGWMEANAKQVKYNGGKEIKIPKITMDGLANYDRGSGFVNGSVTLAYETLTMGQDRGRSFLLDSQDVDETNFVAAASNVMAEFQRTKVIPEIDAYRYSKLATLAIAGNRSRTLAVTSANALSAFLDDLVQLEEAGVTGSIIATLSPTVKRLIESDAKFSNYGSDSELKQGNLSIKLVAINDAKLVPVTSDRLKTAYVFNDGTSTGQTAGGFVPASTAKSINWILTEQTAPIAVSKTDNIRIFDPKVYQDADSWKLDYRKYHELWVPDNKLTSIYANIAA